MDLFSQLGGELRDLFKDLFHPEKKELILLKMEDVLKAAHRIGGRVAEEAEELRADIHHYLKHPTDKKTLDVMKRHAMRLEHETRNF